ncbi:MAG: thioredoxin [Lentisphaeria bacterium]
MAGLVETFTDNNFEQEVLKNDGAVLVDFWAPWCGPCKQLTPVIEEIAEESGGGTKVGKLNVDEAPGTAAQYGIRSIPTILIFKNGEVAEKIVGLTDKQTLLSKLGQ